MKLNKKKLTSLIAAIFVCTSALSAFEWGGVEKTTSEILFPQFNNFGFSQTASSFLWLNSPIGNSENNLYFSSELMYKFSLYASGDDKSVSNILDIDLLKLSKETEFENTNTLSFAAGRFSVADSTSVIFNQVFDGALLKYQNNMFIVSGFAGYTGLLNSQNISMLGGDGSIFASEKAVYSLANPYVVIDGNLTFPSLWGNQTMGLQANGFVDLGKDKASRYYATFLMSGPITNSLFYNATTTFGSKNFNNLMNYSNLSLYYYPLDMFFLSSGIEYASGKNGGLSPFVGITSRTIVSSVSAPETTSAILPNLSVNIVLNQLFASLSGKILVAMPDSSAKVNGVESDMSISYNIFSDFQIGLDVTAYFDVTSAKTDNNFTATFKAAVSF